MPPKPKGGVPMAEKRKRLLGIFAQLDEEGRPTMYSIKELENAGSKRWAKICVFVLATMLCLNLTTMPAKHGQGRGVDADQGHHQRIGVRQAGRHGEDRIRKLLLGASIQGDYAKAPMMLRSNGAGGSLLLTSSPKLPPPSDPSYLTPSRHR
jgi:hypothetical protein